MGRKRTDLVNARFGRWTVLRIATPAEECAIGTHVSAVWWCRCECGHESPVAANSLRAKRNPSRGCRTCAVPGTVARLVAGRRASLPDTTARDARIRRLRAKKWTLRRIAAEVGLSAERVRQILTGVERG